MNLKSLIFKSMCATLAAGCLLQLDAQQTIVLQNGLALNGKQYQGCKDTYVKNNVDSSVNFGTNALLHLQC